MKKRLSILILITLVICSCKKKAFEESVVTPQSDFYFNGMIDGTPVSLKSGVDNYYMYASNTLDSNNVYNFIADLKLKDCNNCTNGLQIKISDFKISAPNEPAQINTSLALKAYPFMGAPIYIAQFKNSYNQTAASYLWSFGDGTSSGEANPTHTYTAAGDYSISLRIAGTNGCQQYIKSVERIKYPARRCAILAANSNDSVNVLQFTSMVNWPVQSYLWNFGDGTESTGSNPGHRYKIPGTYPVSLRVITTANDTVNAKYNAATLTTPMPCLTNYQIDTVYQVSNTRALSSISINWTDEKGMVYSSNDMRQPASSYFKILSVESYDNNEKNEPTKKIKMQFKCNVYNGASVKTIDKVEAVMCVSYK